MITAGPIATPIMTAVSSFGVSASSTIDANSHMAANMATMSIGCRTAVPRGGIRVIVVALTPAVKPPMRLFFLASRRRPQHEMAEGRCDRLVRIVLPGPCLECHDAPALLDDRDVGKAVERAARAQIVDRQPDRLGRRGDAEFARHADDGRGL